FRRLTLNFVFSLVLVLPCLLAWRNFAQIRTTNGPLLRTYAGDLYADLPSGNSVVLSEQPSELLLLQAQLSARHYAKNALLLDASALASPAYHAFMLRHYKSRWPTDSGKGEQLNLISKLASREPLFYLHPSLGVLLELFTAEPEGTMHRLRMRGRLGTVASVSRGRLD